MQTQEVCEQYLRQIDKDTATQLGSMEVTAFSQLIDLKVVTLKHPGGGGLRKQTPSPVCSFSFSLLTTPPG